MLVVAMTFAACWGVVQLIVLGSPARSVRLATLLVAVGVGVYVSGVAAVAIQYACTRAVAAITGDPLHDVVERAGYTFDPFIEEIAKALPLLLVALHLRTRRQWGLTDFLLLGAATGAGFGLLEALARFGHRTGNAIRDPDGWLLPVNLSPPVIPDFGTTVTSWLPAPAGGSGLLALAGSTSTNLHLAWSALAGFGVGLLLRGRGPVRLAGPLLLLLVGADHAAYNFELDGDPDGVGGVLAAPFVAAQPLLWLWPLLALVTAVVLDRRALRAARAGGAPDLRLRRETAGIAGRALALTRYAAQGLPWTLLLVPRFVALRRAVHYACERGVTPDAAPLLDELAETRDRMDVADSPAAWRGAGRLTLSAAPGGSGQLRLLARFWPVVLWALVLVPVALYYVVGATPGADGVQDALERPGRFHVLVLLPAVVALTLLTWQFVTGVRGLPAALRLPDGERAARLQLRLGTALGAGALSAVVLGAWLRGSRPGGRVFNNVHVLDALATGLLIGGIVLAVAAVVFFPPSIGVVAVATSAGTTVLVPTATVSGAFVTTAALGAGSIVLSNAASNAADAGRPGSGSGGGSGGGSVPDIPQRPPAPMPPVRHYVLQRIVRELYKGTGRSGRIGDGTTMDAVRNELRTGRPTAGKWHSKKANQAIEAFDNWLRRYGSQATATDREWAFRLQGQLRKALEGK